MESLELIGKSLVIITVILCLVPAGLGLIYVALADVVEEAVRDIKAARARRKADATMARYAKRFGP